MSFLQLLLAWHEERGADAARSLRDARSQIHQRRQRIPLVVVHDHVDADLADGDGALDADGDMVGVVGDPDGHLFTALEHSPFDEQRFEFDAAEFGIIGPDGLLTQITDIDRIDLPVEEHIERYFIAGFIFIEIDIPGIERGAQDVLDAIGYPVNAGVGDCGAGGLDEGDIFVGLVTALIDVPDEFIGLQASGVYIGLVFVTDFEKLVIEGIAFPFGDHMIAILSLKTFEIGIEGRLAGGGDMEAGDGIIDFVGERFSGLEGGIADAAAEIVMCGGLSGLLSRGVVMLAKSIPGH